MLGWATSTWLTVVAAGMASLAAALFLGPGAGSFLRDRFGPRSAGGPEPLGGTEQVVGPADTSTSEWSRPLRRLARLLSLARLSPASDVVTREAYTVLAAELRAGRSPESALAAAATVAPCLAPAARVARSGGDVTAAFEGIGAGGRALALAWAVSEQAGIGLAALVDRVTDGIADDQEIRREVEAQLAGPRATARMLAGLPALGLLLGTGFGDPLGFLLGSGYGIACLAVSIALAALGLCWVERLARRARP